MPVPLCRYLPAFILVACMSVVSGCSSTSATGSWAEPRSSNAPFRSILVVGDTPNSRVRRSFEQQMSDDITAGGSRATASIYLGSEMNDEKLTRENMLVMTEKSGADAVLVTRLVNRTVTAGKTQDKAYVKFGPQVGIVEEPGFTEVWASDYSINQVSGQLDAKSDARIEAVLYDVRDRGRAVYKVEVHSKFTERTGDEIEEITGNIADAISGKLRGDGLVK